MSWLQSVSSLVWQARLASPLAVSFLKGSCDQPFPSIAPQFWNTVHLSVLPRFLHQLFYLPGIPHNHPPHSSLRLKGHNEANLTSCFSPLKNPLLHRSIITQLHVFLPLDSALRSEATHSQKSVITCQVNVLSPLRTIIIPTSVQCLMVYKALSLKFPHYRILGRNLGKISQNPYFTDQKNKFQTSTVSQWESWEKTLTPRSGLFVGFF